MYDRADVKSIGHLIKMLCYLKAISHYGSWMGDGKLSFKMITANEKPVMWSDVLAFANKFGHHNVT